MKLVPATRQTDLEASIENFALVVILTMLEADPVALVLDLDAIAADRAAIVADHQVVIAADQDAIAADQIVHVVVRDVPTDPATLVADLGAPATDPDALGAKLVVLTVKLGIPEADPETFTTIFDLRLVLTIHLEVLLILVASLEVCRTIPVIEILKEESKRRDTRSP